MKLPIFKRDLVHTLYQNVDKNFELYKEHDFSLLFKGEEYDAQVRFLDQVTFTETNLASLMVAKKAPFDVENATVVHHELNELTPSLAADERVWVALCHLVCPEFVWDRWVKKEKTREKQVASIRAHFFARGSDRALVRSNALSRLWWIAHVATANREDVPHDKAIEAFAKLSDFRSSIFERPSISRVPQVFEAIMECHKLKVNLHPDTDFFLRRGGKGPYREWLSLINNLGGSLYYPVMSKGDLVKLFWGLLNEVSPDAGGS